MSTPDRLEDCRGSLEDALREFDRAEGPRERLAAARDVRACTEALEAIVALQARAEGLSWSKIGAVYGLTKQGAQQRFRPRRRVGSREQEATPPDGSTAPAER